MGVSVHSPLPLIEIIHQFVEPIAFQDFSDVEKIAKNALETGQYFEGIESTN